MNKVVRVCSSDLHEFSLFLFPAENAKSIVILCPAMGISARYYEKFAQALVHNHCHVAIMDLRGQGSSNWRASRACNWGYAVMVEKDWPAAHQAVRLIWQDLPLYFWGHSQGGQLSVLYLAHQPENVAGVVTIAAGSTYYKGWKFPQNLQILLQTQLTRIPSFLLGYFPGDKLGFGGLQARDEMRDWANAAIFGGYHLRHSAVDYERELKKTKSPIYAVTLDGDDFAPAAAAKELLRRVPESLKYFKHFSRTELPDGAGDHFKWTKFGDYFVPKIVQMINGEAD